MISEQTFVYRVHYANTVRKSGIFLLIPTLFLRAPTLSAESERSALQRGLAVERAFIGYRAAGFSCAQPPLARERWARFPLSLSLGFVRTPFYSRAGTRGGRRRQVHAVAEMQGASALQAAGRVSDPLSRFEEKKQNLCGAFFSSPTSKVPPFYR